MPSFSIKHVLGTAKYKRFVMYQEGMPRLDLAAFKKQAEADLKCNKDVYVALQKKVTVVKNAIRGLIAEGRAARQSWFS